MSAFAADTWGIPGPVFATFFFFAMIVASIAAFAISSILRRGSAPAGDLHPYEVAYLSGGSDRALATALAALRADGAITSTGRHAIQAVDAQRTMRTPLDDTVYEAIRQGRATTVDALRADASVRQALDQLHDGLVRNGLALDSHGRTKLRLATLPVAALLGLGLVRLVAGLANDKPVAYLTIMLIILAGILIRMLRKTPHITKAGRTAVRDMMRRHEHLHPSSTPAWRTYGATGAALGVALFGFAAFSSVDAAFAEEIGLAESFGWVGAGWASSSSYSGGATTSSSCSSASSCGGGGGCGGGGCGGGGCGG